jgi:hypothetical protein
MQLIWFNPEERSYHTDEERDYEIQVSGSRHSSDFFILDRLEELEIKVAHKIVDRLNRAYTLYEV